MARQFLRSGVAWCQAALRDERQAGVARNLTIVLAGHLFRLLLGLISSMLLARSLGPEGLRSFAVVGAAAMIGLTMADFGLSSGAIRQINADLVAHPARAVATVGSFVRLRLLCAILVVGLTVALRQPLASALRLPEGQGPLLVLAACLGLLASSLGAISATLLQTLSRFHALVAGQSLSVALTVLLMAGLALAGRLLVLEALLIGALATLASAGLGLAFVPADWRRSTRARAALRSPESRGLLSFSKWVWLAMMLSVLASQLDLLLLNRWLAPELVGFYALALSLSLKVDMINQAMHMVLLPQVTRLTSRAAYGGYLRRTCAPCLALGLIIVAALPLARPFILALYGPLYGPAVGVFYALMPVVLFDLLTSPLVLLAYPMNMPRTLALAHGLRVVILLLASLLLIPVWGLYGAALARLAGKLGGALLMGIAIALRLRGEGAPGADPG